MRTIAIHIVGKLLIAFSFIAPTYLPFTLLLLGGFTWPAPVSRKPIASNYTKLLQKFWTQEDPVA